MDFWWWLILVSILASGAFGGLVRYFWMHSEGNDNQGKLAFVIFGITAALMVPMFLNSISSTLIHDIPADQNKLFILIGVSLAAGMMASPVGDGID